MTQPEQPPDTSQETPTTTQQPPAPPPVPPTEGGSTEPMPSGAPPEGTPTTAAPTAASEVAMYGPNDIARAMLTSGQRARAKSAFRALGKPLLTRSEADELIARLTGKAPPSTPPPAPAVPQGGAA